VTSHPEVVHFDHASFACWTVWTWAPTMVMTGSDLTSTTNGRQRGPMGSSWLQHQPANHIISIHPWWSFAPCARKNALLAALTSCHHSTPALTTREGSDNPKKKQEKKSCWWPCALSRVARCSCDRGVGFGRVSAAPLTGRMRVRINS